MVTDHLKKCADDTRDKIKWLIDIEQRAFTLNAHMFSDYKDKFLSYYGAYQEKEEHGTLMQKLQQYPLPGPIPEFQDRVSKILSLLPAIGLSGTQAIDLARLLPPDPMDPALDIMASVRGYFQGTDTYLRNQEPPCHFLL